MKAVIVVSEREVEIPSSFGTFLINLKIYYPKAVKIFAMVMRILAGSVGAYVLGYISVFAISYILPMPKATGIYTAELIGFLIMPCATMWAFHARTALKAWAGIIIPSGILYVMLLLTDGHFLGLEKWGLL